jgi:acyl carrier protein
MTAIPGGAPLADYTAMVVRALATQVELSPGEIDPQAALGAIPGIESVKVLRAIVEIEEAYAIVVPDDFLFETATVADLAAFVASLVGTS